MTIVPQKLEPLGAGHRIDSLDVLRGFALLGILIINIQSFAMPMAAYENPSVWGSLEGANFLVWLLSHLLADQKMMALFSMLFGAGVLLFTDRIAAKEGPVARLHYRRNFWLLVFGVAHAYVLWYGDILFLYAVCAFLVFPFRRMAPGRLMFLGIALLSVASLLLLSAGLSLPHWSDADLVELKAIWAPEPAQIESEIEAYRGGWWEQMQHRAPTAAEFQAVNSLIWGAWRAMGMMLIGMALYRWKVLTGGAANFIYWGFVSAAFFLGLPLVGYGVYWNFSNNWGLESLFLGFQFNYWGSILVSLGWMSAIILILRRGILKGITQRLAAVGRMAFSNYIFQTLICGFIFYGHGVGMFGQVGRVGQLGIVLAVWAVQLFVSSLWLRHFRFGPLEWLWRTLTYWRLQPLRI